MNGGVGLFFINKGTSIVVKEVIEGGSAATTKALRIRPGDELLAVEGEAVGGWTLDMVRNAIVGEAGTYVTLKLHSPESNEISDHSLLRMPFQSSSKASKNLAMSPNTRHTFSELQELNRELTARVASLEISARDDAGELTRLRRRVGEAEAGMSAALQESQALRDSLIQHGIMRDAEAQRRANAEERETELQTKLLEEQNAKRVADVTLAAVQRQLTDAEDRIKILTNEVLQLREACLAPNIELEQADSVIADLQQQIAGLKSALAAAEAAHTEDVERLDNYRSLATRVQMEYERLQGEVSATTQESAAVQDAALQSNRRAAELENALRELQRMRQDDEETIIKLETALDLSKQQTAADTAMHSNEIETARADLKRLTRELELAHAELGELRNQSEQEIVSLQSELDKAQCQTQEAEIVASRERRAAWQAQEAARQLEDKAKDQVQRHSSAAESAIQEVMRLKAALSDSERANASYLARIQQLEIRLNRDEAENARLSEALEVAMQEAKGFQEQVTMLQKELGDMQRQMTVIEGAAAADPDQRLLLAQIDALNADNVELRAALERRAGSNGDADVSNEDVQRLSARSRERSEVLHLLQLIRGLQADLENANNRIQLSEERAIAAEELFREARSELGRRRQMDAVSSPRQEHQNGSTHSAGANGVSILVGTSVMATSNALSNMHHASTPTGGSSAVLAMPVATRERTPTNRDSRLTASTSLWESAPPTQSALPSQLASTGRMREGTARTLSSERSLVLRAVVVDRTPYRSQTSQNGGTPRSMSYANTNAGTVVPSSPSLPSANSPAITTRLQSTRGLVPLPWSGPSKAMTNSPALLPTYLSTAAASSPAQGQSWGSNRGSANNSGMLVPRPSSTRVAGRHDGTEFYT